MAQYLRFAWQHHIHLENLTQNLNQKQIRYQLHILPRCRLPANFHLSNELRLRNQRAAAFPEHHLNRYQEDHSLANSKSAIINLYTLSSVARVKLWEFRNIRRIIYFPTINGKSP